MKRGLKVLIIVLVILVVLAVAILLVKHFTTNEVNNELTGNSISYDNADAIATMDVVIVRVDDTYLEVINKDDPNDVMRANIPDDDINEYKQNQEVRVYYNGMINEMYPGSFDKVSKIEILKDNSDVTIPEKALKLFYSSRNNVSVSNINVTQTGISFEIKDTNEYKYEYTNTYTLFKKNPEAEQVKAPSMPIVTGNTTSSYEGSGIPLWEEASKVSDVNSEDTVTSENIAEDTVRKICDWTNIYGKLESGEYDFSLTVEGFYIRIKFTVNENGEISNVTSDFM
ncbi:unknown [Clostridium sp. CAG:354]|jgi:hypothetical protein|nr:hypothetical protein [Clostridium sp.]MEE0269255.1 hypothetical protein [Clostridia bacterium]CDE10139.1 unknown [Clostridium sp. CAG:354]